MEQGEANNEANRLKICFVICFGPKTTPPSLEGLLLGTLDFIGGLGRGRTDTPLREQEPKSCASANFATRPCGRDNFRTRIAMEPWIRPEARPVLRFWIHG